MKPVIDCPTLRGVERASTAAVTRVSRAWPWSHHEARLPAVRAAMAVVVMVGTLVTLAITHLTWGPVPITVEELARALLVDRTTPTGVILWQLRLPRLVAAVLGGSAVGLAGLLLQTLFRNPLADPWALGATAGAQLGVALVAATGAAVGIDLLGQLGFVHQLGVMGGAAFGCAGVMVLVASAARRVTPVTLLVLGLMFGYLSQGLVSIVLHFTTRTQGRVFDAWNDGTFANVTWTHLRVFAWVVGAGIIGACWLRKPLDALLLGDRYAGSLGIPVERVRRLVLLVVLALSAPVTSYCGPIAFLGLTAPHLSRALVRASSHRTTVPFVVGVGACLAVGADLIVNLPWERHFLHLNAVNGLLGSPWVIWLLLRHRSLRQLEG